MVILCHSNWEWNKFRLTRELKMAGFCKRINMFNLRFCLIIISQNAHFTNTNVTQIQSDLDREIYTKKIARGWNFFTRHNSKPDIRETTCMYLLFDRQLWIVISRQINKYIFMCVQYKYIFIAWWVRTRVGRN